MRYIVFLLVLWPMFVSAQEQKDRSYFFKCEHDNDCAIVEDACPGFTAVNKKYKGEALEYWKTMMPYIDCMYSVPPHPANYYTAYCNAKKICELKKK